MAKPTAAQRRNDRERTARIAEQLAQLRTMSSAELAMKYAELTGQAPRSKHRAYLRKRVAWHLQVVEYGGLSDAALARIDELIPLALEHFREGARRRSRPTLAGTMQEPSAGSGRDPRLPEVGALLRRLHGGVVHEVTVLEGGFEYRGARYGSLSRIAREVTGTAWNGFAFFGCGRRETTIEKRKA